MIPGVNLRAPKQLTAPYSLHILGVLELLRDGVPVLEGRRKPLLLLAYLAYRPAGAIPRSELAALFWPEADEAHARQSLRQAVLALRDALGEALTGDDSTIRLAPDSVSVDARRFEIAVQEGRLEEGERLWTGEFAAGAESWAGEDLRTWIDGRRAILHRQRSRLAASLIQAAQERGDWRGGLAHAESWLQALPQDPDAQVAVERLQRMAQTTRRPSGDSRALLTPDLVGREAPMRTLHGLWLTAVGGEPALALVTGEEGIGRSRLLEEFLRTARAATPRIRLLQSRGYEAEQQRELALARHLLAPLATAPGVAATPPGALQALAARFPEFAERFPADAAPPDDLAEAARRALIEVAAEGPVLAAVDDFHLADPASRQILEALLRRPVPGLFLILSAPAGTPAPSGSGLPLRLIGLDPLDRAGVEALLAGLGEFAPSERRDLADRLLQETGGNPGLVCSITGLLADEGLLVIGPDGRWRAAPSLSSGQLPLAADLRARLRRRFEALSPGARVVVQGAAILGGSVPADLLGRICGLGPDAFAEALGEAVARRYLRSLPEQPGEYRLAGEAIGRVVYDGTPPDTRRRLHRAAARALAPLARRDSTLLDTVRAHRQEGRRPVGERRRRAAGILLLGTAALAAAALLFPAARGGEPQRLTIAPVHVAADSLSPAAGALRLLLQETFAGVPDLILEEGDSAAAEMAAGGGVVLEETLSGTGSRIAVHARLREAGGRQRQLATADAAGTLEDLPAVASGLARSLFPRMPVLQRPRFRLESARTRSVPALVQYLQGERLARHFDMDGAAAAYYRALQLDTGFVLAWHRLAGVNAWFGLGDRARILANAAVARSGALDPVEDLLIDGWRLFADGRADQAERRFDAALAVDREAAEANIGMGEVLYHYNWERGREPYDARRYWEAARRADPADWRPHAHLWSTAARAGDLDQARKDLLAWRQHLSRAGQEPFVQLALALTGQDSMGVEAALDGFRTATAWQITESAQAVAVDFGRPDIAERLARLLVSPRQTTGLQAYGHELLAQLAAAQGRWDDAQADLIRAARLEPVSAATATAQLWAAPFLPADSAVVAARQAALRQLTGTITPAGRTFVFWFDLDRAREPLIRQYLAGLLALETGGAPRGPWPDAPAAGDSSRGMWRILGQSLAGWKAARGGDAAQAATLLASSWDGIEASEAGFSAFYSRPWDRWFLGVLAERQGQDQQAAGWFAGLGPPSIADFTYAAPAAWREGQALARLGRREEAAVRYQRVLDLWRHADPRFRPMLDSASAALSLVHADR